MIVELKLALALFSLFQLSKGNSARKAVSMTATPSIPPVKPAGSVAPAVTAAALAAVPKAPMAPPPSTNDLQTMVTATAPLGVLNLPAATYLLSADVHVKSNITIIGQVDPATGLPSTFILRKAGINSPYAIWLDANGATLSNLVVGSPVVSSLKVGVCGIMVNAHNNILNNIGLLNLDTGVMFRAGSGDTTINKITAMGGVHGDPIFLNDDSNPGVVSNVRINDANLQLTDNQEHCIRSSDNGEIPPHITDVTITGGIVSNANGKEAIAAPRDGLRFTYSGITMRGEIPCQIGQGVPNSGKGADSAFVVFNNVTFDGGPPKLRWCDSITFNNCIVRLGADAVAKYLNFGIGIGDATNVAVNGLTIYSPAPAKCQAFQVAAGNAPPTASGVSILPLPA